MSYEAPAIERREAVVALMVQIVSIIREND